MAAKSLAQRILEAVAVLLVGAAAVFVGLMVWNNQRVQPDRLQQQKEAGSKEAVAAQTTPASSRPKPGDELRLNFAGVSKIEATPWPSSARLRHLSTNSTSLAMSPDGRLAVASEPTNAGRRLAVWNLEEGKLVRYLSAELEKATRPYAGQDDADFGAKIDHSQLTRVVLSPSGRRCAAVVYAPSIPGSVSVIYAWDLASGKMICRYEEPDEFGQLLLMADDQHVVTSCRSMIVRLNVDTGEADLLRGPDDRSSVAAGTVHNGTLALAGTYGVATISLDARQYTGYPFQKEIDVSAEMLSELGADAMAFIRQRTGTGSFGGVSFFDDGRQLLAWRQGGGLDSWDLATGEQTPIKPADPQAPINASPYLPAPEARLLAQVTKQNGRIQLLDMQTGEVAAAVQVPFVNGNLQGISTKGDRLAFQTDQFTILLADFPGGIPKGTFDLAEVLPKVKLPATR